MPIYRVQCFCKIKLTNLLWLNSRRYMNRQYMLCYTVENLQFHEMTYFRFSQFQPNIKPFNILSPYVIKIYSSLTASSAEINDLMSCIMFLTPTSVKMMIGITITSVKLRKRMLLSLRCVEYAVCRNILREGNTSFLNYFSYIIMEWKILVLNKNIFGCSCSFTPKTYKKIYWLHI